MANPYSGYNTGAAFLSGMQQSYDRNLTKQVDLIKYKNQMALQKTQLARQATQDAYVTEQRNNARFDRNLKYERGALNAEAAGNQGYADMLRSGQSGGLTGRQQLPAVNEPSTPSPVVQATQPVASPSTPRIDTLGAAGVQAKAPMRIGGTARTYDDSGREYISAGGQNYPVETKTDQFGTKVRSADTSRIIPTKQEYDFKSDGKRTASKTMELVTPVTSTLSSRLTKDTPDAMIPTILNDIIENARDTVGKETIEGYSEALLREEKLPIPDSVNRQIVNESIKAIENSGMTEEQKDIAYDKIDSLEETSPRSIIDREAGRFLKKTGIIREITDFFGPRFPASEIDAKSEGDAMRTYATLKEKGYFKENGEVNEDKLGNMVTNLMASTDNPDAIIEAAVGPEGVTDYKGEKMSPEEARNSAQAIYLIKEQIRLKLDAIKSIDKSDGLIGPVVGGTYRIGKKAIKAGYKALPEVEGDKDITTMPGKKTWMRF